MDWIIHVYGKCNQVIGYWEIFNRSESEANSEAVADIEKEFGDECYDWTMVAKNG